ncbi:AI-2E family transporter [Cytobacillus pseudoceanisediminis]|jgi:predicted PurR-regulated permease PerM|uniref:AI-2E family transporter n=1 Tax=Cytobacillus pseudoceanisediminis TaxID=3051614 RepID=A0ABZ2ZTD6_9BACI|nr:MULTISPECIES: AI-2E family transporter [Cytobacillus]MBY0156208.1 AI-2E family transporter [Cytobacillus firmus]MBU8728634.1 AI-2E family transporter [Cytobacillus oceanisediminis]MCM3244110.1 AI-2E family transporter [Cytobacillus oceanisediminis]MCM3402506.1 AI-2E family transporter [Cytobacillus oceanisediminis]QOK28613.1 AI-2E family transporter [Cytobacillus oceanisediminis]
MKLETIKSFLNNNSIKRFIIFGIIVLALYLLRSMINLILITFIFSFLMDRLVKLVLSRFKLNRKLTVITLYMGIIGLLSIGIIKYLPLIVSEISQLFKQVESFYTQKHDNIVITYIVQMLETNEITKYLEQGFAFLLQYFSDISHIAVQVLLSLILSLFFLLEKPKLIEFTLKFKHSKIADFYNEIEYFGSKFVQTFGKVIEAQFVIATVNCILTTLALWIMDFPQLMGLSILIFLLGLIPVAGVIISLVPLCTIAYSLGGFIQVFYIVLVIMVIHAIEAYILNPKLMSSKTDLPVFYTFIVLIFSEHFFGVWGLIVGIPVFVFMLDVLEVKSNPPKIQ